MRTPEEILKDIVVDVNAMRALDSEASTFGPFDGSISHQDYTVTISWPNLNILVREAEYALEKISLPANRSLTEQMEYANSQSKFRPIGPEGDTQRKE